MRRTARPGLRSTALDEDALARALLGRLDHGVLEVLGHRRHAGRAARLVLHVCVFLDVGKAVVEQGEDCRGDLLAETVSRAEILVDPDLHSSPFLTRPPGTRPRRGDSPPPARSARPRRTVTMGRTSVKPGADTHQRQVSSVVPGSRRPSHPGPGRRLGRRGTWVGPVWWPRVDPRGGESDA